MNIQNDRFKSCKRPSDNLVEKKRLLDNEDSEQDKHSWSDVKSETGFDNLFSCCRVEIEEPDTAYPKSAKQNYHNPFERSGNLFEPGPAFRHEDDGKQQKGRLNNSMIENIRQRYRAEKLTLQRLDSPTVYR